jgi:hypothetical protein
VVRKEREYDMTEEEFRIVMKYQDRILELVDNQDEYTRSDIQGGAMAIVMSIIHEVKKLYG